MKKLVVILLAIITASIFLSCATSYSPVKASRKAGYGCAGQYVR